MFFSVTAGFVVTECHALDTNLDTNAITYRPRVEMNLKLGKQRHVGQAGLLMPILQSENSLLYANIVGMGDSKHQKEGNFGLGIRYLNQEHIWGIYGFWDIRSTQMHNQFQQATIGAEWLSKTRELRFNTYLPEKNRYLIQRASHLNVDFNGTQTIYTRTLHQKFEQALPGFDLEWGGHLLPWSTSQMFVAYYRFKRKGAPLAQGIRLRSRHTLTSWISFEMEYSFDTLRLHHWFSGIRAYYQLGKKSSSTSSLLTQKMTQFPVRDIDIISATPTQKQEFFTIKDGYVPLLLSGATNDSVKGNAAFTSEEDLKTSVGTYAHLINDMTYMDGNHSIKSLADTDDIDQYMLKEWITSPEIQVIFSKKSKLHTKYIKPHFAIKIQKSVRQWLALQKKCPSEPTRVQSTNTASTVSVTKLKVIGKPVFSLVKHASSQAENTKDKPLIPIVRPEVSVQTSHKVVASKSLVQQTASKLTVPLVKLAVNTVQTSDYLAHDKDWQLVDHDIDSWQIVSLKELEDHPDHILNLSLDEIAAGFDSETH